MTGTRETSAATGWPDGFNDTASDFEDATIDAVVAARAHESPDAVAIVEAGSVVTYGELLERADAVASRVAPFLDGPDNFVGLVADRSADAVVAMLGVWRAGAAFVPLEPTQPTPRLAHMIEDTAPRALLAPRRLLARAHDLGGAPVIELEGDPSPTVPPRPTGPSSLAYAMFTSGSTGAPKGVPAEHRGVLRYVRGAHGIIPNATDAVLHVGSLGFDASTYEIWGALCNGARLVIHPEGRFDPVAVGRTIVENGVTIGTFSAGAFHLMVDGALESLRSYRLVISGGDVLSPDHATRFRQRWPEKRLVNAYGPTETTVTATVYDVDVIEPGRAVPIGRPVDNTTAYVVVDGRLAAPGEVGELCVGGVGVSRGYLGRPELTAERFVADPFEPGGRLYRTGDLARLGSAGVLEFVGRLDDQVKIRGFLVEPAEVVAALVGHPDVADAEVVAVEAVAGHRQLVAFVVARTPVSANALRAYLRQRLPDYIVPARIETLDAMPLTDVGKHDRAALAARAAERSAADHSAGESAAVGESWRHALGSDPAGPDEDFFAAGGDSLLALALVLELARVTGVDLGFAAVFEHPTPRGLARLLAERTGDGPRLPALEPTAEDPAPASVAQAQACFLAEVAPDTLPYQTSAVLRIRGALDVDALRAALTGLLERHGALRSAVVNEWGVWILREAPPAPAELVIRDVSADGAPTDAANRHVAELVRERIDPVAPPLVRWTLLRLGPDEHWLVHVEHHAAHDGWSFVTLVSELCALYRGASRGEAVSLAPLERSYADFAAWQRSFGETPEGRAQIEYWRRAMAGAPAAPEIAGDRPRPLRRDGRGGVLLRDVDPWLVERVRRVAAGVGATTFHAFLTAFLTLVSRLSGEDDVVVGSGLANRRVPGTEGLVGMLVNTVAVRVDLAGEPSVEEALVRVRDAAVAAVDHQEIPFEEVVRAINPPRRPGHLPFFDHLFSFHNTPFSGVDLGGPQLSVDPAVGNGSAKADLNVVVVHRRAVPGASAPDEGRVTVAWEYVTDLFDEATAAAQLDAYVTLLEGIASGASAPLSSLPLAASGPRADVVEGHYERDATVPELVAVRAAERRDAPAVTGRDGSLTFGELNDAATHLANRLAALGVGPGERVGVVDDRGVSTVVRLLGVLHAGAAYVGFDPAAPRERAAAMRRLADVTLVLAGPGGAAAFDDEVDVAEVDERGLGRTRIARSRAPRPAPSPPSPLDAAYVSFTSGSTGEPKGVEITHRGVVRLARGASYLEWRDGDVVWAGAPLGFDATTFEIWGALLNGASVALAPPGPLSASEIGDLLERHAVTTAWFSAGLFHSLVDHRLGSLARLRQVLAGGDVLSPDHVARLTRALTPGGRFVAGYGPTEVTTFSCVAVYMAGEHVTWPVPLGHPVEGTSVAIVDPSGHSVPDRLAGELWLGGDGLANGYVGRSDLTAERFVDGALAGLGARAYRTGDRARRRADGALEFLGRADRQVKIRGFRVELGDVEAALVSDPDVAGAHVIARTEGRDDRRLVAYVVPAGGRLDRLSLARRLADVLPAYMTPTSLVELDELPLRPNGKVDASRLPEPPSTWWVEDPADPRMPLHSVAVSRVDGASALEQTIIGLWQEVLGVRRVGLHDDFFDLGGHSLLAVELFAALERATGARLALAALFEAPTVAAMAEAVRASGARAPGGRLVTLTASGERPPVFAVSAGDGNVVGFGPLARRLGPDQPFYGLQPRGLDGVATPHRSVEAMAREYEGAVRSVQPTGPYVLIGRCFGALVAYELARTLEASGERVALVVSIDSGGPLWRERRMADGTPYDPVVNEARVRAAEGGLDFGDVFADAAAALALRRWLTEADPEARGVSRYVRAAWLARPDLRAAYPLEGAAADPEGLRRWAWTSGRAEMGMEPALLGSPPPGLSTRRPPRRPRRSRAATSTALRPSGRHDVLAAAVSNSARYRAGPLVAPVMLVHATGDHYAHQRMEFAKWHGVEVGGLTEREVYGSHHGILREPAVADLARVLAEAIDDALNNGG